MLRVKLIQSNLFVSADGPRASSGGGGSGNGGLKGKDHVPLFPPSIGADLDGEGWRRSQRKKRVC